MTRPARKSPASHGIGLLRDLYRDLDEILQHPATCEAIAEYLAAWCHHRDRPDHPQLVSVTVSTGSDMSAEVLPARQPCHVGTRQRSTAVNPAILADDSPLALVVQLHLPAGTTQAVRLNASATPSTYLRGPDGSWAEIDHAVDGRGRRDTREAGPTRLVAAIEQAFAEYHDLRHPGWTDFGVTATPSGSHIWVGDAATGASTPTSGTTGL